MPRSSRVAIVLLGLLLVPSSGVRGDLLVPLPSSGRVPPIVLDMSRAGPGELTARAEARAYRQQIRLLRRKHFGHIRRPAIRAKGIEQLAEFTDPAAFSILIDELGTESRDVQSALLDHFVTQGDTGQAALAWIGIHGKQEAFRTAARRYLVAPPADPAMRVIEAALRSRRHAVASRAASVAQSVSAMRAIPLLIFAQATRDVHAQDEGDLAWIAIETQQAFVADVTPVVGPGVGAFEPILGVVSEGIVLRVEDAVAITYRTVVHEALVELSTRDFGRSTADMGYDMNAWWTWYNEEYVPKKNEETRRARMVEDAMGGKTSPE